MAASAGRSTSEWLATVTTIGGSMMPVLAGLIDAIMKSGLVHNNMLMMVLGMVSSLLATLGYTASRSYVKAAAYRAGAPSLTTRSPVLPV